MKNRNILLEETIKKLRLRKVNDWYYSEQGLILTDDDNNVRKYISKVSVFNEIDDKNNELIKKIKKL